MDEGPGWHSAAADRQAQGVEKGSRKGAAKKSGPKIGDRSASPTAVIY
jgi:hypothetical protein